MEFITHFGAAVGIAFFTLTLLGLVLMASIPRISSQQVLRVDLCELVERLVKAQAELAEENREMRSAVRAERAHVEQLQRKTQLMQAFLIDDPQQPKPMARSTTMESERAIQAGSIGMKNRLCRFDIMAATKESGQDQPGNSK